MPARAATRIAVLLFPLAVLPSPSLRAQTARVSPETLEAQLVADPSTIPQTMRALGEALMTDRSLDSYLPRVALAYANAISPTFSRERDLPLLTIFQFVDPMRYLRDPAFRARIDAILPRTLDASVDRSVRAAALHEMNDVLRVGFDVAERAARAWGFDIRDTATRKIDFDAKSLRMPDDLSGPIEASIYSINSNFFTVEEARAFLTAVRKAAPKRRIVVLSDLMLDGLAVDVIDTRGRPYTPWPRDPFTIAHDANGGVVFVNRPNLQPDREEDANFVRGLIQALPKSADEAWKARWTIAKTPFHNGHILLTPDAVWISLHTVEIRALQILGISRVPVQTFDTAAGITRYENAVKQAANELATLYERPVHFVHPLEAKPELMRHIAGGAGIDLDSIVTMLPPKSALVGDLTLGENIARTTDWTRAHAAYHFTGDAQSIGTRIADAQSAPRVQSLQTFLDTVAQSLVSRGITVRRVPLLNIPATMIREGVEKDFLLTWNNVVLEPKHAEGFASLLDEGDAMARDAFAKSGYALTLYPPLIRSVQLSGGYRCASNHVRPPR